MSDNPGLKVDAREAVEGLQHMIKMFRADPSNKQMYWLDYLTVVAAVQRIEELEEKIHAMSRAGDKVVMHLDACYGLLEPMPSWAAEDIAKWDETKGLPK